MSASVTLSPRGLFTSFNLLSQVESGALVKANNIVINQKYIIESRRGIKYYSTPFDVTEHRARQLLEYKGLIISHVNNKLAYDDGEGNFTTFNGTYTDAISNLRIRGIEYKGNYYFTSGNGVQKISAKTTSDITATSITEPGSPMAYGIDYELQTNTFGFLEANKHTAYKVTWAYRDNNNLLIEGVPSYQTIANNNTDYTTATHLTIYIPKEVTGNYFFRLYRCETRPNTEDLSDEYNLVYEGYPTALEILAGKLTHTDIISTASAFSGLPLYTNPNSGTGATDANFKPPYASDIALYQNHIFYANCRQPHSKTITLQNINGITPNVTDIILSSSLITKTYHFKAEREKSYVTVQPKSFFVNGNNNALYFLVNSANNKRRYYVAFKYDDTNNFPETTEVSGRIPIVVDIKTAVTATDVTNALIAAFATNSDMNAVEVGTNLVSIENIGVGQADATADSIEANWATALDFDTIVQGQGENLITGDILCDLDSVNNTVQSLVNVINADNTNGVEALYLGNGKIYIQRTDFSDVPFYVDTTDLIHKISWFPNLSATNDPSENNKQVNGLYFSKQDEPESVPLLNFVNIGSSDSPILRIVALRESLFIFKTDGLFRLSGYDKTSFSINLYDNTTILKAPDSVAVLRNVIYFFGTQGVTQVSETGTNKISNPIDDKIIPMISKCKNLDKLSFGISYETDEAYMLWSVLDYRDTVATVCYRYNIQTDSWVEWRIAKTCAVLNAQQDKLYFGSGVANTLEVERKDFSRFDYADREININLPALSYFGNIIRPTGASQIEGGDVIIQYQGVTINQFNQIINMLNVDPSNIGVNDFSGLIMNNGRSLTIAVASLVNYLNIVDTNHFLDTNNNTQYVFTGSTDFTIIQAEWFKIIDRLNQSPAFFYSNYPIYDRITPVEANIVTRDIANNDIYLQHEFPFMEGSMLLYKAITSEVEFVPQTGGDAVTLKQFHTAQMLFQNRSINSMEIGFNSDLSTNFEYVQFAPSSAGVYGSVEWGEGVWGGEGDSAPLRTYVPQKKQRARYLGIRARHIGALEQYNLYGIALHYNENSDRAYK